jgi:DNA-binding transcriptional LysR family regulator
MGHQCKARGVSQRLRTGASQINHLQTNTSFDKLNNRLNNGAMNWDDCDVFCHVIEHHGFTAAARAMERPKSSVSAAVSRVEDALGTRLLERTTRHIRLTEAGQALYDSMGALFSGLHEARSDALAQGKVVAGTLRICGPHEFCTYQLGPVACVMMMRYPQLKIRVEVEDDTINPLEHRYDIAFSRLDGAKASDSLVQRRVIAIDMALFASPELLQRCGEPSNLQDLAQLPLVCSARESEWTFEAVDGSSERMALVAPRLISSNSDVRRQAAIAGVGVARLPSFFGDAAVRARQLRRILTHCVCTPLRVYSLLPAKRLMPAKVRLFLDELDQHILRFGAST